MKPAIIIVLLGVHIAMSYTRPTDWRAGLPEPVLADHPEWIDFYYDTWRVADMKKVERPGVGWFFDSAHRPDKTWTWDEVFVTLFASYVQRAHPLVTNPMAGMDHLYSCQRADGYIPYRTGPDRPDTTDRVQNPIYPLAELNHYTHVADTARLRRTVPIMDAGFYAVKKLQASAEGPYLQSWVNNGMDNRPTGARCIDLTAQQAMNALLIARMAHVIGDTAREVKFRKEHEYLATVLNTQMWDDRDRFYLDMKDATGSARVNHWTVGAFWPLLAEIATRAQAEALVTALEDTANFKTFHRVPSLGKRSVSYDPTGNYWRGAVWAPTNMMVIRGLMAYGYEDLALDIAVNDLESMFRDWKARAGVSYWECYHQEKDGPAAGKNQPYHVGWTGVMPIAGLIENIVGIRLDAPSNVIRWRIRLTEEHGVRNLKWGPGWGREVDLVASRRSSSASPVQLKISSNSPFTLEVDGPLGVSRVAVAEGRDQHFTIGTGSTGLQGATSSPDFGYQSTDAIFHCVTGSSVRFTLPERANASGLSIVIRSMLGKTVFSRPVPAGQCDVVWDGLGEGGHAVSGGVYVASLESGQACVGRTTFSLVPGR